MRILLIISSAVLIFFGVILSPRQQEAQAFDPVIASTLAPVATKAFKEMHPYMVKGLSSGGRHMVSMGKDVFEIFYYRQRQQLNLYRWRSVISVILLAGWCVTIRLCIKYGKHIQSV